MSLRWLSAADYQTELRCSGNEVAVGSCSGSRKDCPGKLQVRHAITIKKAIFLQTFLANPHGVIGKDLVT